MFYRENYVGKEKVVKLKEIFSKEPSTYKEMYKSLFEIDPICYDLLKSRVRLVIERVLSRVLEKGDTKSDGNILDIGCGTGLETAFLGQIAYNGVVIGVDKSALMLGKSRERAKRRNLTNVYYIKADREEIPLNNNSIDTVLCMNGLIEDDNFGFGLSYDLMLNHVLNTRLKEFHRILRDNGKLILCNNLDHDNEEYVNYEYNKWNSRVCDAGFNISYQRDRHLLLKMILNYQIS